MQRLKGVLCVPKAFCQRAGQHPANAHNRACVCAVDVLYPAGLGGDAGTDNDGDDGDIPDVLWEGTCPFDNSTRTSKSGV